MSSHVYKSCLCRIVVCFMLLPQASFAASRISVSQLSYQDRQQLQSWIVSSNSPSPALAKDNVLREISQHQDDKHITHRRMQQEYHGFMVYGGYVILHAHDSKKIMVSDHINGAIYRDLDTELGLPDLNFVPNSLQFLEHFKTEFNTQTVLDEQVVPMVYIDNNHKAHWAYRISVLLQPQDAMIHRPTIIIDAKNSQIYQKWDDLKTLKSPVMATGFGGNPRLGYYQYGIQMPLLHIYRDHLAEMCFMENKQVRVVDVGFQYDQYIQPMKFPCDKNSTDTMGSYWTGYYNDGYDRINEAYSPSNDAMYVGEVIQELYLKWYNVNALTLHNKPMQLIMRVHYGKQYENAFWDGKTMTFGDGHSKLYPLVALDVGAHEVSHGFTEQNSNLEYYDQSGGMNESFSDMAGKVAEYYVTGTNNWTLGAGVVKSNGVIRYLDEPSRDGRSIDNAKQYQRGMDVHYLSGVYNRLFYLLSTLPNWNPRMAFHIMLKANMDYWTPTSTFAEGSCGVLFAAQDLNFVVDDVKKVLAQVGLGWSNC